MKKKITIDGMHCAGCAASVEKAIKRVEGVQNVSVQLTTETADIEYEGSYPQQEIQQAVEKAGYELSENQHSGEISFDIEGMHCAGCSAAVEKAAMKAEGVNSATVNLAAGKAFIEYDSGIISPEEIARRIDDAGYTVVRQKKKMTS